jgi:hypothetical protein
VIDDDLVLKTRFRELRAEEERRAPHFRVQPVRRGVRLRPLSAVAAVLLVFVVTFVAIGVRARHTTFSDSDRAVVHAVGEWRPPTEFLLRTPGDEILTNTPPIPDHSGVLTTTRGLSQ